MPLPPDNAASSLKLDSYRDIVLQIEQADIPRLRRACMSSPQGLTASEFVLVLKHVNESLSKLANNEPELFGRLCLQFFDRVCTEKQRVEWSGISSFLVELTHSTNSNVTMRAGVSKFQTDPYRVHLLEEDPQSFVEFAIQKLRYFPSIGKIVGFGRNRHIYLRNPETFRVTKTLEGHTGPVLNAIHLPEYNCMISSSIDRSMIVWEDSYWKISRRLYSEPSVAQISMLYIPEYNFFFTGGVDGIVRSWDLHENLGEIKETPGQFRNHLGMRLTLPVHSNTVTDMAYPGKDWDYLLTVGMDARVQIFDFAVGSVISQIVATPSTNFHQKGILSLDFQRDLRLGITAGLDNDIFVWNPAVKRIRYVLRGHTRPLLGAKMLSPTGYTLISADRKNTIKLWDLRMMECFQTLQFEPTMKEKALPFTAFELVEDQHIVTTFNQAWHRWNSGDIPDDMLVVSKPVTGLSFNDEFSSLVACSVAGISVWDVATGMSVSEIQAASADAGEVVGECSAINVLNRGRYVFAGDSRGTLRVYSFSTGALIRSYRLFGTTAEISHIMPLDHPTVVVGSVSEYSLKILTFTSDFSAILECRDIRCDKDTSCMLVSRAWSLIVAGGVHGLQYCKVEQLGTSDREKDKEKVLSSIATPYSVVSACFCESMHCMAVGTTGSDIQLWDPRSFRIYATIDIGQRIPKSLRYITSTRQLILLDEEDHLSTLELSKAVTIFYSRRDRLYGRFDPERVKVMLSEEKEVMVEAPAASSKGWGAVKRLVRKPQKRTLADFVISLTTEKRQAKEKSAFSPAILTAITLLSRKTRLDIAEGRLLSRQDSVMLTDEPLPIPDTDRDRERYSDSVGASIEPTQAEPETSTSSGTFITGGNQEEEDKKDREGEEEKEGEVENSLVSRWALMKMRLSFVGKNQFVNDWKMASKPQQTDQELLALIEQSNCDTVFPRHWELRNHVALSMEILSSWNGHAFPPILRDDFRLGTVTSLNVAAVPPIIFVGTSINMVIVFCGDGNLVGYFSLSNVGAPTTWNLPKASPQVIARADEKESFFQAVMQDVTKMEADAKAAQKAARRSSILSKWGQASSKDLLAPEKEKEKEKEEKSPPNKMGLLARVGRMQARNSIASAAAAANASSTQKDKEKEKESESATAIPPKLEGGTSASLEASVLLGVPSIVAAMGTPLDRNSRRPSLAASSIFSGAAGSTSATPAPTSSVADSWQTSRIVGDEGDEEGDPNSNALLSIDDFGRSNLSAQDRVWRKHEKFMVMSPFFEEHKSKIRQANSNMEYARLLEVDVKEDPLHRDVQQRAKVLLEEWKVAEAEEQRQATIPSTAVEAARMQQVSRQARKKRKGSLSQGGATPLSEQVGLALWGPDYREEEILAELPPIEKGISSLNLSHRHKASATANANATATSSTSSAATAAKVTVTPRSRPITFAWKQQQDLKVREKQQRQQAAKQQFKQAFADISRYSAVIHQMESNGHMSINESEGHGMEMEENNNHNYNHNSSHSVSSPTLAPSLPSISPPSRSDRASTSLYAYASRLAAGESEFSL
jgi:WD40 repeat protein